MDIHGLLKLHELALEQTRQYTRRRFLYDFLAKERGKHFIGIVGPRGAGKTVLLRQYALEEKDAFYLSADTLDPADDLWELVGRLRGDYGFHTLLLDEIHFLPDAPGFLKRVFDFLDIRIVFSSSVALAMHSSAYDLSRRVRMVNLHPFSYREYLAFRTNTELPRLTLEDIVEKRWDDDHLRAGHKFERYLRGGVLPYSLDEAEPLNLLHNITEKVITRDIPSVLRLAIDEAEVIRRLLTFVGRSEVDGINYSSLSRNLAITKYKAEQYVSLLEQAFVLRRLFPSGTNVLREPKVLMALPYRLLYREYGEAVGALREDFFAEAMAQAGIPISYLKSTRGKKTPDFLIGGDKKIVIEVGGKGKGREQFKGIEYEQKLVFAHTETPDRKRFPLFLLGYLS